ncbi:hypothetical protein HPB51_017688 [Rhipicephalus microplus]|uniref:Uncharacterized protein n=1 Tax=Rhipicephalus microplus TaxID=6941 RepID=A0A9J6E2U2_RHIMP|nr:hypothetical protein HPB51_017688 [Rhipicephalus microplus]
MCPNPSNKMCRVCGYSNPSQEHRCDPQCQLCGKGHFTGDRQCKAKYKIPYLVKRRQWERRTRDKDAAVFQAYGNRYDSSNNESYYHVWQNRHLSREGRSASHGASGSAGKSHLRSSTRLSSRSLVPVHRSREASQKRGVQPAQASPASGTVEIAANAVPKATDSGNSSNNGTIAGQTMLPPPAPAALPGAAVVWSSVVGVAPVPIA